LFDKGILQEGHGLFLPLLKYNIANHVLWYWLT